MSPVRLGPATFTKPLGPHPLFLLIPSMGLLPGETIWEKSPKRDTQGAVSWSNHTLHRGDLRTQLKALLQDKLIRSH